MLPVSAGTTWQKHLFGGVPDLVESFHARAELEFGKIVKLLDKPEADYIDNERRLRALSLICQINDHAAKVLETQIEKYVQASNEMAPFRDRSRVSQNEFDRVVMTEIKPGSQPHIDMYYANSNAIYLDIYNKYFTAGYYDQYTTKAEDKLLERNLLPEYTEIQYPLDSKWSVMLEKPSGGTQKVSSGFGSETMSEGRMLTSFNIPARHNLVLEREFKFEVMPEFAFVFVAYEQDSEIWVNGQKLEQVYIQVDDQDFGMVYAIRIDGDLWKTGSNSFKGVFPNAFITDQPFHFSSSVFFEADKLSLDLPTETQKLLTDSNWTVISIDPETNEEIKSYAIPAENFNIPMDRSVFLTDVSALPIWTVETQENLQTTVVFETEFEINGDIMEGYLDFVAPDSAKLYLNGRTLGPVYQMSYNTNPFLVYPSRADLPVEYLRPGLNTLRIEVQNYSPNRGMIAELSLTQSAKE